LEPAAVDEEGLTMTEEVSVTTAASRPLGADVRDVTIEEAGEMLFDGKQAKELVRTAPKEETANAGEGRKDHRPGIGRLRGWDWVKSNGATGGSTAWLVVYARRGVQDKKEAKGQHGVRPPRSLLWLV
jgi:hypothetical protein